MAEPSQTLDRFTITRTLGKGGMGTVYLARDQRLGRQVALKVLNAENVATDERRARFLREARAAAAIRHQNVATIYEVDQTAEDVPFIVMEFCEGETLADRIRRKPIDAGTFLSIARQIASGVAAAHENGVVHRDIKSPNIILEPNGLVKVLDFGLARLTPTNGEKHSFESTSNHFFGTLHYLSPEQARGQRADERSDLFGVGVVLYQMASGHLPFNGQAPLMVLEKIRDAEPEPFVPLDPAFPAAASRIIGRLLQKNPDHRYQTARELLQELEAIDLPTLALTSKNMVTRNTFGRTVRRSHWTRVAIIAAALAVIGLGVWYASQRKPPAPPAPAAAAVLGPIRSLAVLPLENISNNTHDDFLSVGVADALVTKIQQIPSLQVRPTSAVLDFRNQRADVKTASEKLKVDAILAGRFLAAGDLVRINLQLTDARTGYNVWADTINGKRQNLLKLIDDVSAKTVSGLNQKLGVHQEGARSEPRSASPKAYEQYLRARSLADSLVPADHAEEIASLKRAVQIDPTFAAAYADLAIALSLGNVRGFHTDPDTNKQAELYARAAVRLDPNLPESHLALGRTLVRFPDRFRESVRETLAAVRLNSGDPQSLNTIVTFFISSGDLPQAQCVAQRLISTDPSANDAKIRGYWYLNAVDPDLAIENAKYALASKDSELAGHDILGNAYILQGNWAAAEAEQKKAAALVPQHYIGKSLKALIAAGRGDRAAAEAAIASFQDEASRTHWAAQRIAYCYAKLGDKPKAVEWLRKSLDLGNHSWYLLGKHPWLRDLQGDPQVQQILGKMKADLDDVRDDVVGVYQLICK